MSLFKRLLILTIITSFISGLGFTENKNRKEYTIHSEDVLEIKVYEHKDLTTKVRVSAAGDITFPLIGQVHAAGLTVNQLCEKIKALLNEGYLVDPQVNIFIESYHPEKFFVMGAVRKPAAYELSREKPTTVLEAISRAGGFTEQAAPNRTKVIRVGSEKGETIKVKVTEITKTGDKSKDIPLQPNDIVFVPESIF
ncbi:polysaccharide export protein [bacterium]|nr:polysaccharide export protein [bacterium]